jgi:hypothetical protein
MKTISFTLPNFDSMELQAKTWCEINAKPIKAGHGIFLELKDMPNF